MLANLKIDSALFIDGKEVNKSFSLASNNIPNIDVLPVAGINVYDIFKRDFLVLSSQAIESINERLSK